MNKADKKKFESMPEYARFKETMRKVLTVSKEELEKREKEWKASRNKPINKPNTQHAR